MSINRVKRCNDELKAIRPTIDEVKFILAKLAQVEFKGVEIEFTYNLIVKLQEHFKYLSKTQ